MPTQPISEPVKRRAGRPKDDTKRVAILLAAQSHFLQHGYSGASMDAIAAQANVSKLTIYSHFTNKDALFQHVIHLLGERLVILTNPEEFSALPPAEMLKAVGRDLLSLWLNADILNLHRLMMAESSQQSKANRLMMDAGPERSKRILAEFLDKISADPTAPYAFGEGYRAAGHFRALLRGDIYTHTLLRLRGKPSAVEIEAHASEVAELFLRAHRQ